MSSFLGSPHSLKAALISNDLHNSLASVAVFQYNPKTMTCQLELRSLAEEVDAHDQLKWKQQLMKGHNP